VEQLAIRFEPAHQRLRPLQRRAPFEEALDRALDCDERSGALEQDFPETLLVARKALALELSALLLSLSLAILLRCSSSVYGAQGKHAEAEAYLKRALAIQETKLGKEHPDVANTLNDLGVLYREQGKYAEAEPHLKRALAIYEQKLGQEHPHVATTLNALSAVYWGQGKYPEAAAHFKRALMIAPDGEVGQQAFAVIREAIDKEGNRASAHRKKGGTIERGNIGRQADRRLAERGPAVITGYFRPDTNHHHRPTTGSRGATHGLLRSSAHTNVRNIRGLTEFPGRPQGRFLCWTPDKGGVEATVRRP